MPPRPDVSEERKKQIVDAATNVFAREGMDKARMDDIAEEAGLSKGALYWYFKSKDAIITAILDSIFAREIGRIKNFVSDERSTREMLSDYTETMIKDVKMMMPFMPILFEFWAKSFRNKSIRNTIRKYMFDFIDATKPIIQKGIESGELRSLDPQEVTLSLGAIFEGSILVWSYDPENVDLAKTIKTSVNLFLEGIEKK